MWHAREILKQEDPIKHTQPSFFNFMMDLVLLTLDYKTSTTIFYFRICNFDAKDVCHHNHQ